MNDKKKHVVIIRHAELELNRFPALIGHSFNPDTRVIEAKISPYPGWRLRLEPIPDDALGREE